MSKLIFLLKQSWLISLLGILALSALIWFATPFIAIAGEEPFDSPVVRLLIILLLMVFWGFSVLYKQLKAARAGNQMIDDLASSAMARPAGMAQIDESAEEIALLQRHFDEAMEVLKRERKKGNAGNLYSMPWYVIIGPPAAGKTTALLNSGLKFPLQERFGSGELKGVGGTLNCDWLFTDKAVLLDTAGRYVTQDSHAEVDSAAWEGFLDLLKKRRRRRPVNGVLVAISLVDLMQQDAAARQMHIQAIKQRIHELYKHFNMRLPVYVLLTKSDLIAGFTEYFDDMGREERSQVWGFTLPLGSDEEMAELDIARWCDQEFDALLERLDTRVLFRMSQEHDFRRRDLIYGFPRQLGSLKQTLVGFLADIFQGNRYEEPIMLRGVYLTSGTQEGAPIDRLMGNIARAFGLQQQALPTFARAGRGYFINRLLNNVVFPEAGLAGYDTRAEARRAWLQRGAYASVLVITALAALAWLTSYTANTTHITQVADSLGEYLQRADETRHTSVSVKDVLARLNALRATTEVASQYQGDVPLHRRFWLYQGDVLTDAATDAYIREMNNSFVPLIAKELESQLERYYGSPQTQYEALKTYLMLGKSEHMQPDQVKMWMTQSWQKDYPRDLQTQAQLQRHLDTLLQGTIKPALLDEQLVTDVRQNLKQASRAKLAYGRLIYEGQLSDRSTFRVADAVGLGAREVFVRASDADIDEGIPALFTYSGFHKFYQLESRRFIDRMRAEDWVLADESGRADERELEKLDEAIRRLYIADYIRQWENLLNDINIIPFDNVRHATEVLAILSSPASPMVGLLDAVKHNTMLTRLPGDIGDKAQKKAEQSKLKGLFAKLLDSESETGGSTFATAPGSQVEQRFEALNRLVEAEENRPPPVQKLVLLLSDLYGQMLAIESGYDSGAMLSTADGSLRATIQELRVEGARQRHPVVKRWIQQVADYSQLVAFGDARQRINAAWVSTLLPDCERALKGRYPFQKNARYDVALDDFSQFFAPGGKLDQFFQKHLAPLVDTSQSRWRWLSSVQATNNLSTNALHQMQRAAAIKAAFYPDGQTNPNVQFEIKPVFLDKAIKRITLDLEGQRFDYSHGPQRFQDALWPGPRGSSDVRIIFKGIDRTEAILKEEGPWAWFRMLDRGQRLVTSSDRFNITYDAAGRTAKYEIRASSVVNPFTMRELQQFQCPREF